MRNDLNLVSASYSHHLVQFKDIFKYAITHEVLCFGRSIVILRIIANNERRS